MERPTRYFGRVWGATPMLAVISILILTNVIAVIGILAAGRETARLAYEDLRLETEAVARSLEAALASARGDFLFLTQSSPLVNLQQLASTPDPMERRWQRIAIEASLLLYMNSHPEVSGLTVSDEAGQPAFLVGRREGAPVLLSTSETEHPLSGDVLIGEWPIGEEGRRKGSLRAALDVRRLLDRSTFADPEAFSILDRQASESGGRAGVEAAVSFPAWNPPVDWLIARRAPESGIIHSVEQLATTYRSVFFLNITLLLLLVGVGVLAIAQTRKGAVLEEENRQQFKIRDLERQLFHSDRLASIGRMVAGLAHEINNPLEGMANYLTLATDDISDGKPEAALGSIVKVREGLDRITAITRRALDLSRPGETRRKIVNLDALLQEIAEFIRHHPPFDAVTMELSSDPADGVTVQGEPVMLNQLFLNLLLNAAEHQAGPGTISVGIGRRGQQAVVTVADSGPGIPEENHDLIFEPFFSTRGSTGLGLSVCLNIVELHGGSIQVENRPDGSGAVFSVILPAAGTRPAAQVLSPGKFGEGAFPADEEAREA